MSIEFVQITYHAYKRWNQRVRNCSSEHNSEIIYDIIEAVKKSKIIKKHEKLPCVMPRVHGSVYSIHENILFVLECVDIKTYRLVTVMTDFESNSLASLPSKFNKKRQKYQEITVDSVYSKGNKIKNLKIQISKTPKRCKKRKELLKNLFEKEELNKDQIFYTKKSTEDGIKRFK